MRTALLAAAFGLALSACQTAGPPPAPSPQNAPTGVTPNPFRMPTGSGCAGEVDRFQAVMDKVLVHRGLSTLGFPRIQKTGTAGRR